jgi:hypothetical protein
MRIPLVLQVAAAAAALVVVLDRFPVGGWLLIRLAEVLGPVLAGAKN